MIDLYNGDCLELMKKIPNGSVDMILCDLPYGTTQNKWDSIIDLDKLWKEYKRIMNRMSLLLWQVMVFLMLYLHKLVLILLGDNY